MTVLDRPLDHNYKDLADDELKFVWSLAGRNLPGERLQALANGIADPEGAAEEVYVRVRRAMIARQLPL